MIQKKTKPKKLFKSDNNLFFMLSAALSNDN